MRASNLKIAVIAMTLLSFTAIANAQTIYLNNRQYDKIDGQWYQIENGYQDKVNNSVITVKFQINVTQSEIDAINQDNDCEVVRVNILGYYDLEIPDDIDPLEVVQEYINSGLVEVAEPNTIGEYLEVPNDPYYSNQWFHHNEDVGGIESYLAWDKETGDPNVIIGILDSGTEILHIDLEGNIWVNPGEDLDGDGVVWDMDDINGIDDDGNGYVDDLVGWDFGNDNNDVTGPYYHGTHVAGVTGAVTNNNTGVAGVAGGWSGANPGCKMLIGGVGDSAPIGDVLDDAIIYAALSGVKVITMSLTVGQSSAIEDAIETAYNDYNCFVDCASGNSYAPYLPFPANNEYVFAVGASMENKMRVSFSNYGEGLDVVAPGVDIYSTRLNNSYGSGSGTSFAAPQVAGVAGLIASYHPDFTNTDIERVICWTAEKLPDYDFNEEKEYGRWNNEVGYGKLNADRALGISGVISSSIELTQGNYMYGEEVILNNGATLKVDGCGEINPTPTNPDNDERMAGCLYIDNTDFLIQDGSIVEVDGNEVYGRVTLSGLSLVEVTNGSKFNLSYYSSLYGTESTTWVNTDTGNEYDTWEEMDTAVPNHNGNIVMVPGDRIVVNSNGEFDAISSVISGVDGNFWDGFYITQESHDAVSSFQYCDVSNIRNIDVSGAYLFIWESHFHNFGQIFARDGAYLNPAYSLFENSYTSPILCWESTLNAYYDTIRYNNGMGISLSYPDCSSSLLDFCLIDSNSEWGIQNYNSAMWMFSNEIVNNDKYGFVSLGGSKPIIDTLLFSNNGGAEIIASCGAFPIFERFFGMNTIVDDEYEPGPYGSNHLDQYLLMCGNWDGIPIDVTNVIFPNENDPDFEDRFYPSYDAYIFDGERPSEKIIYEEGIAKIIDEDYESAKLDMKDIVDNYPETETAEDALQWLMYLEKFSGQDYATLRSYIENIDSELYTNLEMPKFKAITSTFMAEKDYETAIARHEIILANPPSVEDSLFAFIDEGYCYLKLDEQGGKAAPVECTFKPRCFEEFKYVSQNLTRNLLDKAIPHPEPSTPIVESFALYQNYPNPMRTLTTISFSATDLHGFARIKICNVKGQLVKEFSIGNDKSSIVWDGRDENGKQLGSGIYFYKLDTGEKSITKKMVILR